MKNILLILGFVLFLSSQVFPQNKTIDSLKNELKTVKHDTLRSSVLLQLGESLLNIKPDSALKYFLEVKDISEKKITNSKELITVYKKNLGSAYNNIGMFFQMKGQILKAIESNKKSLEIFETINYQYGIAVNLYNLGLIYESLGENNKSLDYFQKSLSVFELINNKVIEVGKTISGFVSYLRLNKNKIKQN